MPMPKGHVVTTLEQRFEAKVVRGADHECWLWQGFVDKAGYGRIRVGRGRDGEVGYAHRVSYAIHAEAIPEGFVIDHLCRNRACVNQAHLEAVTNRENCLRGEAPMIRLHRDGVCANGHVAADHSVRRRDGRVIYCQACRDAA